MVLKTFKFPKAVGSGSQSSSSAGTIIVIVIIAIMVLYMIYLLNNDFKQGLNGLIGLNNSDIQKTANS